MLPLSKGCCLFPSFVVWSVLCGCGFLTSLFGLLSGPAGWLCLIYDSLELMVQNHDLCLWCCDWTSAGSLASSLLSVSPSLSLTCSLWMWWATAGEWVGCWSASPHSTSFVFVPPLPFCQKSRAAGWQGIQLTFRQGHQTLSHLFIYFPLSKSLSTSFYTLKPHFQCIVQLNWTLLIKGKVRKILSYLIDKGMLYS